MVEEAAQFLSAATSNVGAIATKSNARDLVTEWDTRSEDLIRGRLSEHTPGVTIVGEERGASEASDSDLRWLVDPLDGTVNFSHGLPLYGVTISLEHKGTPVVGVTAAPALGWLGWATRGGGAFERDGTRLQVSTIETLEQSMLVTGFPYDRATSRTNFAEWEHFQCKAGACRRLGAASLDLYMVARGWLDGYWETRLNPWDISAGALLVAEAGGRVSNITGGPVVTDTGELLATNGAIHEDMMRELARVRAGQKPGS